MNGLLEIFPRMRFQGKKISAFVNLIEASGVVSGKACPNRRNFSQSSVLLRFRSHGSRYSYTEGPGISEVFKHIYEDPKGALKKLSTMLKEEFKLLRTEIKYNFSDHLKVLKKGDIDMLFTFDHDKCLNNWIVTTDSSNNQGFSTANFIRSNSDTVVFSGNIVTAVPRDGKTKYAGFASILTTRLLKSFKRLAKYNWMNYTHLVLKVRGDGRTYMVILGCPGKYDLTWQDQFHYPLYTRGGPYWQIVKIPFSNFYFTSKARIQDRQCTMEMDACSRVGITLADGIDGPFKLEIEYFGLEYQPLHKDICPYEGYYLGKNVAD